jgi:hypothetical protein
MDRPGHRRRGAGLLRMFLLLLSISAPLGWSQTTSSREAAKPKADPRAANEASVSETTKEDWSSLGLAGSNLHSSAPLLGEKDNYPDFTRELLQVQWRSGDPIDLYVILPKGVKKPPVILYLYGYPSDTDTFLDPDFCKLVTKNGFAAIGFVSALTGHRYHDRPMREWFVSELQESLATSVHDVQMILNYLATRGDLDMDHVGMFGEGSGGTIAILAAAVDPRIKVLDLLDPWGDWPDWMAKASLIPNEERANYLKPEFLKRVEPLDPIKWLPQLRSRTVRLQDALYEKVTPSTAKKRIESAMPTTGQIVRYKDSHALGEIASEGRFFDWVKEQLRLAVAHEPAVRIEEGAKLGLPTAIQIEPLDLDLPLAPSEGDCICRCRAPWNAV